jgi:hypothetical protein
VPVRVPGIIPSEEAVLVMLQLQTWLCCVSWCGAVCVVIVVSCVPSEDGPFGPKHVKDLRS